MKALSSLARARLAAQAEGMDAPMGGVDAMAGEDYAGEAGCVGLFDALERHSLRKRTIDERSSGSVCAGAGWAVRGGVEGPVAHSVGIDGTGTCWRRA